MNGKGRISFEDIRERAYELWERHHRPEGFEIEFWLLAEREIRTERERGAANPDNETSEDGTHWAVTRSA